MMPLTMVIFHSYVKIPECSILGHLDKHLWPKNVMVLMFWPTPSGKNWGAYAARNAAPVSWGMRGRTAAEHRLVLGKSMPLAPPIFLGMVTIPPIKMVMTGEWQTWSCFTHISYLAAWLTLALVCRPHVDFMSGWWCQRPWGMFVDLCRFTR